MSSNIILDWSGTLVNDLPPVLEATNKILLHYGRPELSLEEFRETFRLPFIGFWEEQLPGVGLPELEELYHRFFDGIQDRVDLLPGAKEFLDYCRATGRRVFLLSSIKREHWEAQSARLQVADYFEQPYVQVMDKKQVIGEMLVGHRLDPAQTIFVGDMVHDIETARHGGVLGVATLTGFDPPGKLATAEPEVTVQDLHGLRRMLQSSDAAAQMVYPVVTVGALIRDRSGRYLMLRTHKWSGKWGIPGGKVKRGESSEQALIRELKEETGLTVERIRFVMVQDCIDSDEFLRPAHFLLQNYLVEVDGERPDVVLNDEAEAWQWVSPAAALEMELNQPTRILIEEVSRNGG